jgi:hypothetical protein
LTNPIREQITERGLKYKYVAEQVLGISSQHLWNKLAGLSRFTDEERSVLAIFFEMPVEELFPEVPEAVGEV